MDAHFKSLRPVLLMRPFPNLGPATLLCPCWLKVENSKSAKRTRGARLARVEAFQNFVNAANLRFSDSPPSKVWLKVLGRTGAGSEGMPLVCPVRVRQTVA